MEQFIKNSSYYIIKDNSSFAEYYDRDGNFLEKVDAKINKLDCLLDYQTKGLAKISKISFTIDVDLNVYLNFFDKNDNIILKRLYQGKLTKNGIVDHYRWDHYYNDNSFWCDKIDYLHIKNNHIEIDDLEIKKIQIANSSYYIIKKTEEKQYAEFFDRDGNQLGTINLLESEYDHDSSYRLDHLIDPQYFGKIRIKKISFASHFKLGMTIYFIDKNNNIVFYCSYNGKRISKNDVIEYYHRLHHDNKIDFDYIKNNEIEFSSYDKKLEVTNCTLY